MSKQFPARSMTDYADLLMEPYRPSSKHLPMAVLDRAAQFAPYAALVGYEAIVEETARLTDSDIELSDGQLEELNMQLYALQEALQEGQTPAIDLEVFVPDSRKSGGARKHLIGFVRRIDEAAGYLELTDKQTALLSQIRCLQSPILQGHEIWD